MSNLFFIYLHYDKVHAYDEEIYKNWNSHFGEFARYKYIYFIY